MVKVEKNRRANLQLRKDNFFQSTGDNHSSADEVCEAVIRAAQTEYEEAKIRFQGSLLGNIPFYPEIDQSQANLLVRLSSELSYRQFCLLALFFKSKEITYVFEYDEELPSAPPFGADQQEFRIEHERISKLRRDKEELARTAMTGSQHATRQETYDLYARALIRHRDDGGEGKLMLVSHLTYDGLYLTRMGQLVVELLQLDDIDHDQLENIAAIMREHPPYG
jgi:hypothetical protein